VIDMHEHPSEQVRQRRRDRSSGRPAHWPSLKHGAD
jgi:ribosomal protein S14